MNGSGKTTLLRILNGSYTTNADRTELHERSGALIAAGAGFSPTLTGRENVFISGTLLGMHPSEIHKKFDEIVTFANLGCWRGIKEGRNRRNKRVSYRVHVQLSVHAFPLPSAGTR